MGNTFDLKTKVQRALQAFLIGTGVGSPADTFASEVSTGEHKLPCTIIDAGHGVEEDFTGNYRFHGRIIFHDDATQQPNQPDPTAPMASAQARVNAILGQLTQSTDGFTPTSGTTMVAAMQLINQYANALAIDPSNGANQIWAQSAADNADMADFSMLYWRISDYGLPEKADADVTYYKREIYFECLACNSGGRA